MNKAYALLVSLLMVSAGVTLAASPVYAHGFCGSGYICVYDDLAGNTLLAKKPWTDWAQSVCYSMTGSDTYLAGRASYFVNDSSHNLIVSTNYGCSGTTAPIYAHSYGPMNSTFNNNIYSWYRVD